MIDIDADPKAYILLMEYEEENKAAVIAINNAGGNGK